MGEFHGRKILGFDYESSEKNMGDRLSLKAHFSILSGCFVENLGGIRDEQRDFIKTSISPWGKSTREDEIAGFCRRNTPHHTDEEMDTKHQSSAFLLQCFK